MKVSILVPVYGVEKYIERCARSLFEQTYKDIEYIFVNDCSPDDSINVLQSVIRDYPVRTPNIRIINHKCNLGLAASRITGLSHASGDYVMFMDSDDYLDLDGVEVLINKILTTGCDIVSAGITHVFMNGLKYIDSPLKDDNKKDCLCLMLERKTMLNGVSRLYKKDLFDKLEDPFVKGLNFGEDYLMTSRIFYYAKSITYVDKPIYKYFHENLESYTSQFKRHNFENLLEVDSMIYDFYHEKGEFEYLYHHQIGRLKLKAEQLILILRTKNVVKEDYNLLLSSFTEDQHFPKILKLPKQDFIILKLSEFMPLILMKVYVKLGYKIKQIVKRIK